MWGMECVSYIQRSLLHKPDSLGYPMASVVTVLIMTMTWGLGYNIFSVLFQNHEGVPCKRTYVITFCIAGRGGGGSNHFTD